MPSEPTGSLGGRKRNEKESLLQKQRPVKFPMQMPRCSHLHYFHFFSLPSGRKVREDGQALSAAGTLACMLLDWGVSPVLRSPGRSVAGNPWFLWGVSLWDTGHWSDCGVTLWVRFLTLTHLPLNQFSQMLSLNFNHRRRAGTSV